MRPRPRPASGVTLIELMVVVGIIGVVLTLVAPSFRETIQRQRVQSINSQLVSDIQFGRSEAAARNAHVRVSFRSDASQTCYSIYVYPPTSPVRCNCLLATPCTNPGFQELRTVRVPVSSGVRFNATDVTKEFALDSRNGSMFRPPWDTLIPPPALNSFPVEVYIDSNYKLVTTVGLGGRPTVCMPAGSKMRADPCP